MFGKKKEVPETQVGDSGSDQQYVQNADSLGSEKSFSARLWPVIACGAGLFSDGYINNVRLSPYAGTQGD
jgi:hypothetical protein